MIFKRLSKTSNYSIEKLDILFQYQFGFHSTVQAITEPTDTLRKAIDSNLCTCEYIFWLLKSVWYCKLQNFTDKQATWRLGKGNSTLHLDWVLSEKLGGGVRPASQFRSPNFRAPHFQILQDTLEQK